MNAELCLCVRLWVISADNLVSNPFVNRKYQIQMNKSTNKFQPTNSIPIVRESMHSDDAFKLFHRTNLFVSKNRSEKNGSFVNSQKVTKTVKIKGGRK